MKELEKPEFDNRKDPWDDPRNKYFWAENSAQFPFLAARPRTWAPVLGEIYNFSSFWPAFFVQIAILHFPEKRV